MTHIFVAVVVLTNQTMLMIFIPNDTDVLDAINRNQVPN